MEVKGSPVVVLASHWMGDTFLALQVVPALLRVFERRWLHVLVRDSLRWLALHWLDSKHVHGVTSLVSDRRREGWPNPAAIVAEALAIRKRIGRPSLLLDLSPTPSSRLFALFLRPQRRIAAAQARNQRKPWHIADLPWMTVNDLLSNGGGSKVSSPSLPGAQWAPLAGRVVMVPGAGWRQKMWPVRHWFALASCLASVGLDPLFLVGPDGWEGLGGEQPQEATSNRHGPKMIKASDEGFLEVLCTASLVVSTDSGPAHIAAALGVPTLVLFGPTNPSVCAPRGRRVEVLTTSCPQRPTGLEHHCHGRPAYDCGRVCMEDIYPDRVLRACKELLSGWGGD